MIERADQRQLVQKVGGVFKLCSLIQKRMRELVMGARPLVELDEQDRGDLLSIVLHEIQEGKVSVAEEGEVGVDFEFTRPEGGLVDSIDLDELKGAVPEEDIDIVLPGEEDQEEEEEEGSHPEPHPAEAPTPSRDHDLEPVSEEDTLHSDAAEEDLPAEAGPAGEGADDDDDEDEEEDEDEDEGGDE